MNYQQYESN